MTEKEKISEFILQVAQKLNNGIPLLTIDEEKTIADELNAMAAQKALSPAVCHTVLTLLNLLATRDMPSQSPIMANTLDLAKIIQAARAISREIVLDDLLKKMAPIVLEISQAQRIVLLTQQDGLLFVQAESVAGKRTINIRQDERLETRTDLPLTLIQYVQKTMQVLAIADAAHDMQGMLDPYVQRTASKSLLILPVCQQAELQGILYLENNEFADFFTQEHVETIKLLAAQTAISLENANLYHQASHDPLTKLANRNLFYETFKHSCIQAKQQHKLIALFFFDLDYFKKINDNLGHDVGDKFLFYIAQQLKNCLQKNDLAARFGGDEFVVLVNGLDDAQQVDLLIQKLFQRFSEPAQIDGYSIPVSASAGISLYPTDGEDIHTLLEKADTALYQAKEAGKNNYQFYAPQFKPELKQVATPEIKLQQALERNEFKLFYQPVIDMRNSRILSIEALLRWQHPSGQLILPENFIPLAERTGLIAPIGEWVLRTACTQNKAWLDAGIPIVPVSVNLSVAQLKKQSISRLVANILQETRLEQRYLDIEFTETMLLDDIPNIIAEIKMLKAMGIKLSIDDFGTGYSNLVYLKMFPVDSIKIDPVFMRDIERNKEDAAIIVAMIDLLRTLKIQIVVVGVENKEQIDFLSAHQVYAMQGDYFSKPVDVKTIGMRLMEQKA
jgi:diguanylate cyclase (GGDEF)-like protein